jgi:hypothetical protein
MKWLFRIIAVIVILLAVGVFVLYLSLDHIVKSVVETQGTEQLNVPTTLGSVNLGLLSGSVGLDSLAIGSPAGFTAPQMFSVGKLSVDTGGVMRLRDQPIHLSSIVIDQPQLVIEQHGDKLNFRELMDHLPSHPDQGAKNTPAAPSQTQPTKLIIDTLTITNSHVLLRLDIPGLTKEQNLALPTLTLQKIGNADGANNGVAMKDVVTAVISQMVTEATHSSGLPINVQDLLNGNLSGVQDKLTGAAQKQLEKAKVPVDVNGLLNQFTGNKGK